MSDRHFPLLALLLAAALSTELPLSASAESAAGSTDEPAAAAESTDPIVVEGEELAERLRTLFARRSEFQERMAEASGEDLLVLEEQNWQRQLDLHAAIRALTANLTRQEEQGRDVTAQREALRDFVRDGFQSYPRLLDSRQARLTELRAERDAAPQESQVALEKQITEEEAKVQTLYQTLLEVLDDMQSLGLEVGAERADAEARIARRAETIAGRITLARGALQERNERLAGSPADSALETEVQAYQERLDRATENLSATLALMSKLGLDRTQYQQLLIETTGEITTDILDTDVVIGLLGRWRDQTIDSVATHGPSWVVKTFVLVLTLAVFRMLSALTRRIVARSVQASRLNFSQLLRDTLVSWSSRAVMVIGVLVALSQLGVQIGPLLAGLGIAGFVLGFALQDTLSNFAAGAMILLYRPFDVGHVIRAAGVSGTVSNMSLVSTTILTFDNQTLIVPNTKIWGDVICNVTQQTVRRVDLVFGIGYSDDIDRAEAVLREIVSKHEKILDDPAPVVEVHSLGESSVDFVVRPWVRTEDYWAVHWSLMRQVKKRFDAEGISIPFPQRDIHLYPANRTSG